MTKPSRKPDYFLPFARIFTRAEGDAYDSFLFREPEAMGDESFPALTAPQGWSDEAVAALAEAAATALPAETRAREENTVPSWLWQREAHGEARTYAETDLRQIFDRIVGAAAATAWREKLFTSERHARAFYDEARYALMQRHVVLSPELLRAWGLDWAYGVEATPPTPSVCAAHGAPALEITNAEIDALLGNGKTADALWMKKRLAPQGRDGDSLTLRLLDIEADWGEAAPSTHSSPAAALIDVMVLRHNDGSLNIDALRQTVRLTAILLDLGGQCDAALSLANLSPLLLALGLAYDSEAGRALAASILALVTAEGYATSAELAALRGASPAFVEGRETIMRRLRNHRRAAYGDKDDYEKLSVRPVPLPLNACPDLTLAAEAQRRWDDALDLAHAFGLRAVRITDLTPSPTLALLSGCAAQGLEPMASLLYLHAEDEDRFRAEPHAAVAEALTRLGYPHGAASVVARHIAGARNLRHTPAINATSLRARGFGDAELAKVEAYLPQVNTLRLAITPWIVGLAFCRDRLGLPMEEIEKASFDLLHALDFDDEDIALADAACYGAGTARNAKVLHLRHRPVFACGAEIGVEARLRMAAATQGFVSGATGIVAPVPATGSAHDVQDTVLAAWRNGIKSLTVVFDPTLIAKPARNAESVKIRRIKAAVLPQSKLANMPRKPLASATKKAPAARAPSSGPEKRPRGD